MIKKITGKIIVIFLLYLFAACPRIFAAESVALILEPSKHTVAVGENINFSVKIANPSNGKGISGFDVCLGYDPSLVEIKNIGEPTVLNAQKTGIFTQLKKNIDNKAGSSCFTYVAIVKDEELPQAVNLPISAQAKANGAGTFMIKSSQVVGNTVDNEFTVNPTDSSYQIGAGTAAAPPEKSKNPLSLLIEFINRIIRSFSR